MIVCDLDGTLLHSDFTYTKRTMDALKKAISQGIRFLPASGRTFQDIASIFHKEGILCGAICVNGAQACDEEGTVLFYHRIDGERIHKVISIMQEYNLSIQIFTDNGFYAYENAMKVALDMQEVVSRNMGKRIANEEVQMMQKQDLVSAAILKLETMNIDDKILDKCRKKLACIPDIEVTSSVHGNLEITDKHSTKGRMLEELLQVYHLQKEEVLIFGDSDNDKSMFTGFPNTVAVANAKNSIKSLANIVCEACEDDGVAKYIEEHICM